MNDNENIVNFPTKARKEKVKNDRIEAGGFTMNPSSPYTFDSISFNFDPFGDTIKFNFDCNNINYSPILNQPTKLERLMDQCCTLQKRIVFHAASENDVILKMIEDKIEEALYLANLNENI